MTDIVWTDPAVSDLNALRDYISRDSPYYANSFISEIFSSVERLARFPKSGREVPEIHDGNTREIFVGNYRVIYDISGSTVRILTVLHMARYLRDPR